MAAKYSEKYEPIRVLGEGSFGKVYLMRDKPRRALVCVKVIKIRNIPKKEREATKMEVDLLRRLNHPNIVRYMDSFLSRNGESLCICMEYCDGGDLAGQIKAARRNLFSESKILHYFVQMALGLQYMHTNKVLHRDLKTQNVFLLGNGRLVLGDLGISKVLDGTMDFAQTCIGTPYYMSPEIFKNKPYSYKSDVWALGCVLYEMTTLNHAFDAGSLNGLAQKIIKGRYPPIASKYSSHLRELISQMLNVSPNSRPDLDQILRKPFIKKHILNFFSDVISRPSSNLGEGTMIIRAAVGVRGSGPAALANDVNMLSLRAQLKEIGMEQQVEDILNPKPKQDAQVLDNPIEVKRRAREQAGALRREEEHKKMIEAALEKLKFEREQRSKVRADGVGVGAGGYRRNVGYAKPAVPRQADRMNNRDRDVRNDNARDPYVQERERQREREREAAAAQAAADQERRRKIQDEKDRLAEQERIERKKREDVRIEARMREEARLREERIEADKKRAADAVAANKQQLDLLRAKQEAAARRDQQKERERSRQREEIEQLKRDKIELDRRAAKIEQNKQAKAKADAERQYAPLEHSNLYGARGVGVGGENKEDLASVFSPSKGNKGNAFFSGASDDDDDMSARDKVLYKKQEKIAKEETDRINELRRHEEENRRIRYQAQEKRHLQYNSNQISRVVAEQQQAVACGGGGNRPQARGGEGAGGMELDELTSRLRDATKDKLSGRGFGAGSGVGNVDDRENELAPPAYPGKNSNDNNRYNDDDGDGDSDSDLDDDLWGERKPDDDEGNDSSEEEDLAAREEELQDQLNMATMRCAELTKNLQGTVSFMHSFSKNNDEESKSNSNRKDAGGPVVRSGGNLERLASAYDDVDPEDDDLYDGSDSEDDIEAYPIRGQHDLALGRVPSTNSEFTDADSTPRKGAKPSLAIKASPYVGLQDAPSPSGKLGERIERLRQRCIEALGKDAFNDAYQYLQDHEEMSGLDDEFDAEKKKRMRSILGDGKAHYAPLIEQLLFMELSHCG
jgi:serine/threonine protein kinase